MFGGKINGYKTASHLPPPIVTVDNPVPVSGDGYCNFLYTNFLTADFVAIDALLSSDHFRMFEFKVRMCASAKSHDWTECPFAHPGERARRRDPRKFHYSGTVCPDFRRGSCRRGAACEYAHGVFECWLHPARYRTQVCKDGVNCTRRVCFFAHSPDQLRVLRGFPQRITAVEPPELEAPPLASSGIGRVFGGEIVTYLEHLQLNKLQSMPSSSDAPEMPAGKGYFDAAAATERVESGRDLRARMFEKLSQENPLSRRPDTNPDVSWISELVK